MKLGCKCEVNPIQWIIMEGCLKLGQYRWFDFLHDNLGWGA